MLLLRKHWFCRKLNRNNTQRASAASDAANERSELEGGNWQSEALVSQYGNGAQLRLRLASLYVMLVAACQAQLIRLNYDSPLSPLPIPEGKGLPRNETESQ